MATTHQTRGGAYLDAGGVHTYYEVRGAGDPVILLHGGMCTAETFDGQAPALAERGVRQAAADLARAIPQAQLGVVPGASHGLPMEKPEVVNRLVLDFLAAG